MKSGIKNKIILSLVGILFFCIGSYAFVKFNYIEGSNQVLSGPEKEGREKFEYLSNLDDVNKEIIQMTSQKIESDQLKELIRGSSSGSFTPAYLNTLGFDLAPYYRTLTVENIEYVEEYVKKLEVDKDTEGYYLSFLEEWKKGDYSRLVEVHKKIFHEYADFSNKMRFKEIDDYRLATPKEEQDFLDHYSLNNKER
ncbi:DUF6241 domain-containing protein [Oceanobacillus manasiensis]|uniref:DUF6241 domain-containing protein n=1 Tax=Oceanobacillus manasiensis TaxID=586413 RepID=UPI0005AA980C|nr:DUF6241 domain-containing protein [Oceanobacillus manasiensis]